jgi:ribosome maturation factor RimP
LVKETLIQELNVLISACLEAKNLEFIDLICRPEGKRLFLTVLVDKPLGGINLQECALLCRQLKNLLEEKNIIENDYVLEVSSPGLDRILKKQRDFLFSLNKEAVFFLNDLVNGKCQWQGVIAKVDETTVYLQTLDEALEIPLVKINKAQLVI